MTIGKTIALTIQIFVSKVMFLLLKSPTSPATIAVEVQWLHLTLVWAVAAPIADAGVSGPEPVFLHCHNMGDLGQVT